MSSLIVKTQHFGSSRKYQVKKQLWKTHGGLGSLRQSTMRHEPTQPACEYGSHKQSSVAVVGTSCHFLCCHVASRCARTSYSHMAVRDYNLGRCAHRLPSVWVFIGPPSHANRHNIANYICSLGYWRTAGPYIRKLICIHKGMRCYTRRAYIILGARKSGCQKKLCRCSNACDSLRKKHMHNTALLKSLMRCCTQEKYIHFARGQAIKFPFPCAKCYVAASLL